jgi:hypothetical protein
VALLAVGAWFARDTIIDAWDQVYDKASDLAGNDTDGGKAAHTTTSTGQDAWAEATEAEDRAFDDWMKANRDELTGAFDSAETASHRMNSLAEGLASGGTIDYTEFRAALVQLRDDTLRATQILDTAPTSSIRDEFVTVLLLSVNEMNQMITATDERDDASIQAVSMRLERTGAETDRLCRQYGARAKALCE